MINNPSFDQGDIVENGQPCKPESWITGPHTYWQVCPKAFIAFYDEDAYTSQINVDLTQTKIIEIYHKILYSNATNFISLFINDEEITPTDSIKDKTTFTIPTNLNLFNATITIKPKLSPLTNGTIFILSILETTDPNVKKLVAPMVIPNISNNYT